MKKVKYSKLYHLSDYDLDGYGCQYLVREYFSKYSTDTKLHFYTGQYQESLGLLKKIQKKVKKESQEKILVLVTDLAVNSSLYSLLQEIKSENIDVLVIDHHVSFVENINNISWIKIDQKHCAAKNTYFWLEEMFKKDLELRLFASIVDAHDRWVEEEFEYFQKGNSLSDMVFYHINYPKPLLDKKREHLFYFFRSVALNALSPSSLEDSLKNISLMFIWRELSDKAFVMNEKIGYQFKLGRYFATIFPRNKYSILKTINNFKVCFIYDFGKEFQYFASPFLREHDDIDILINITKEGLVQLRSKKEEVFVNKFSHLYFSGGGHKSSAGGKIKKKIKNHKEMKKYLNKNFQKG